MNATDTSPAILMSRAFNAGAGSYELNIAVRDPNGENYTVRNTQMTAAEINLPEEKIIKSLQGIPTQSSGFYQSFEQVSGTMQRFEDVNESKNLDLVVISETHRNRLYSRYTTS